VSGAQPVEGGLPPQVLAFLDKYRDVTLFCRDASGKPLGYPMRTAACRESTLTFTTYRKSAKVRHVEMDPRVCVLATDQGEHEVTWVSVTGRARIVTPSEDQIRDGFGPGRSEGRLPDGRVPAGMGDFVQQRLREGKRILLQIEDLETPGIRSGLLR
jgi:hypothetical protein